MEQKTNVMRLLEGAHLPYHFHYYDAPDGALSGIEVAQQLSQDPDHVFKTLVTTGASGKHYVFMIPVAEELSLKKAAAAAKEKSIVMLKSKDLLPLTGYLRGGCSPIGMKKAFPTFIQQDAQALDRISVSAGVRGCQVILAVDALARCTGAKFAELCRE